MILIFGYYSRFIVELIEKEIFGCQQPIVLMLLLVLIQIHIGVGLGVVAIWGKWSNPVFEW